MGQIRNILLAIFCIGFIGNIAAQENFYTVRLGTFVSPQHEDFAGVHDIGFVYSDSKAFDHKLISIGDYTSYERAVEVMLQVRQKGFPDAMAMLIPMAKKESRVPVIQIAQIPATGKKDWGAFFRAHPTIFARQLDGVITVYAGGFGDKTAAELTVPFIEDAGFKGAFAKMEKTHHLQSIKEFESGIEQIAYAPAERVQPSTVVIEGDVLTSKSAGVPVSEVVVIPSEPTAPVVIEKTLPVIESQTVEISVGEPSVASAPVATVAYPSINGKIKRNAAIEIQRILKADKVYSGSLDGYYGAGTEKAFVKFATSNRQWRKYQMLMDLWGFDPRATGADLWNEIRVLRTITSEINGSQGKFIPIKLNEKTLSTENKKALLNWNESLWTNLTGWSKRDPMHTEIAKVLKVAFFQAQLRVEEHFISKGQKPIEARVLAIQALKGIVGGDLDRFTE